MLIIFTTAFQINDMFGFQSEVKVVGEVSEKWNYPNLMYIYHKQCEIMQEIQWNSSNANFTDFPLTDGAAVEQQMPLQMIAGNKLKGEMDFSTPTS